jgi:preprotein translocase subunit SecF
MIEGFKALYRGDNHFGMIARSRLWLTISFVAIAISLLSLAVRGLNFGLDFKGGSLWVVPVRSGVSEGDVRDALSGTGLSDASVQFVTQQGQRQARISSRQSDSVVVDRVKAKLSDLPGASAQTVEVTSVGPSWGQQISRKAVEALIIFLIIVTVYISFRFEWKMALAALAALAHDLIITGGVYSISGFQVVPATVIATLTILGYSLYDTVVVFDKVQENTSLIAQQSRQTYSDTVNDSLNQVMMRSLNTSLTALIPVGSLLVVGVLNPAGGTLRDFALALFVGLASGTYSSIFFASPILVFLKEHEPRYQLIRERLETRAARPVTASARASRRSAAVEPEPEPPEIEEREEAAVVPVPAATRKSPAATKAAPARRPKGGGHGRPKGKAQGKRKSGGKRRR